MRGANRVAEDPTTRPLREDTRTTSVIEMDVSRKHGPKVLQSKAEFADPTFDGFDGAGRAGIEEHEAAFHRRQE